jgi:hypothetical protein
MRQKLIRFIIRILLPQYSLELTSYTRGMRDNLKTLHRTNYELTEQVKALSISKTLPKNFDTAVNQINEMTSKARATFLFRLVEKMDDKTFSVLEKYIEFRNNKVIM